MQKKNNNIDIDELKEQHRRYAELIGINNLLILSKVYGGTSIYIPKIEEILKNKKYAKVMEEFDGGNIKKLARKYGISERTIYRLVQDTIRAAAIKPMDGQLNIFDNECFWQK